MIVVICQKLKIIAFYAMQNSIPYFPLHPLKIFTFLMLTALYLDEVDGTCLDHIQSASAKHTVELNKAFTPLYDAVSVS